MVLNTYVSTDQLGQGAKQPKQDDQENEDVEISDISDEGNYLGLFPIFLNMR